MKNVTITLPEHVAKWARVRAAEQDISLSRMLADLLTEQMQEERAYLAAMTEFMGLDAGDISGGVSYPERDSLHER